MYLWSVQDAWGELHALYDLADAICICWMVCMLNSTEFYRGFMVWGLYCATLLCGMLISALTTIICSIMGFFSKTQCVLNALLQDSGLAILLWALYFFIPGPAMCHMSTSWFCLHGPADLRQFFIWQNVCDSIDFKTESQRVKISQGLHPWQHLMTSGPRSIHTN